MENSTIPNTEVIEASGGLLWRGNPENPEIAVIHRPRYNDWTLPKGKKEIGESWIETAEREVFEETGCKIQLGNFAGGIIYTVLGVPKVVLFWHMKFVEDIGFTPTEEVDQMVWLNPEEARNMMSYPAETNLIPKDGFEFISTF
jgi:8-oxo-dGTP pyrophosphatase MutT (NUDIX family)